MQEVCNSVHVTIFVVVAVCLSAHLCFYPFCFAQYSHKLFSSVVLKSQKYVLLVTGGIFVQGGNDY